MNRNKYPPFTSEVSKNQETGQICCLSLTFENNFNVLDVKRRLEPVTNTDLCTHPGDI